MVSHYRFSVTQEKGSLASTYAKLVAYIAIVSWNQECQDKIWIYHYVPAACIAATVKRKIWGWICVFSPAASVFFPQCCSVFYFYLLWVYLLLSLTVAVTFCGRFSLTSLSVAEMQNVQRAYFYQHFPILHLEPGDWETQLLCHV